MYTANTVTEIFNFLPIYFACRKVNRCIIVFSLATLVAVLICGNLRTDMFMHSMYCTVAMLLFEYVEHGCFVACVRVLQQSSAEQIGFAAFHFSNCITQSVC